MAQIIDGKRIAKEIKDKLKEEVSVLKERGTKICLAVIQVGQDAASSVYVNNKKKACAYVGIESVSYELDEDTTEEELVKLIENVKSDGKSTWNPGAAYRFQNRLMKTESYVRFHRTRMWTDFIR